MSSRSTKINGHRRLSRRVHPYPPILALPVVRSTDATFVNAVRPPSFDLGIDLLAEDRSELEHVEGPPQIDYIPPRPASQAGI